MIEFIWALISGSYLLTYVQTRNVVKKDDLGDVKTEVTRNNAKIDTMSERIDRIYDKLYNGKGKRTKNCDCTCGCKVREK